MLTAIFMIALSVIGVAVIAGTCFLAYPDRDTRSARLRWLLPGPFAMGFVALTALGLQQIVDRVLPEKLSPVYNQSGYFVLFGCALWLVITIRGRRSSGPRDDASA